MLDDEYTLAANHAGYKNEHETDSDNEKMLDKATTHSKSNEIKLKRCVIHAIKFGFTEIYDNELSWYVLICKDNLVSHKVISSSLPPTITNLLHEYIDVFSTEIHPGLPHIRGIKYQTDLIPGATLLNRAAYRTNPEETKEI